MQNEGKSVLLVSMPFAETSIPSIQLALLESYLQERNINIASRHLYLKTAEFYGLNNYNFLINSPNDSYIAQMVFSKYVFPEHWEKNVEKFRYFYENIICKKDSDFSFDKYVEKTDEFYSYTIDKINWKSYDIIGFTLNYGQFLPSLAIAKKIKELFPEKTIIFGGSTIINELGKRILKTFDWIDYVVSGEGEEPLYQLVTDIDNKSIPGLIYRNNKDIIWNQNNDYIDLNSLPFPNFKSYYQELENTSDDVRQYFLLYGRLPIELSRGCWWNKCTFCNLQSYHKKYREKTIERFIKELSFLSNAYKMLTFQIIGNTLPQNNFHEFCNQLIKLDKDLDLYIEARAGQLKSEDYTLLKQAGFNCIQTGIETFSHNYLKKINKGVTVIDNIAALKFCKENQIKNIYNIIINYPNEEKKDFEETKLITSLFKQYLDPPQISKFVVGFESLIYKHCDKFNIEMLEPKIIDTIMYPKEVLDNNFYFFSQFKRKQKLKENNWEELVKDWKNDLEKRAIDAIKQKTTINQLTFYYIDGHNFIKIFDKRFGEDVALYVLNELERKIFLSCIDVVSYEELRDKFSDVSESELKEILDSFVQSYIVFNQENLYLSLPLSYAKIFGKEIRIKSEQNISVSQTV